MAPYAPNQKGRKRSVELSDQILNGSLKEIEMQRKRFLIEFWRFWEIEEDKEADKFWGLLRDCRRWRGRQILGFNFLGENFFGEERDNKWLYCYHHVVVHFFTLGALRRDMTVKRRRAKPTFHHSLRPRCLGLAYRRTSKTGKVVFEDFFYKFWNTDAFWTVPSFLKALEAIFLFFFFTCEHRMVIML